MARPLDLLETVNFQNSKLPMGVHKIVFASPNRGQPTIFKFSVSHPTQNARLTADRSFFAVRCWGNDQRGSLRRDAHVLMALAMLHNADKPTMDEKPTKDVSLVVQPTRPVRSRPSTAPPDRGRGSVKPAQVWCCSDVRLLPQNYFS